MPFINKILDGFQVIEALDTALQERQQNPHLLIEAFTDSRLYLSFEVLTVLKEDFPHTMLSKNFIIKSK